MERKQRESYAEDLGNDLGPIRDRDEELLDTIDERDDTITRLQAAIEARDDTITDLEEKVDNFRLEVDGLLKRIEELEPERA